MQRLLSSAVDAARLAGGVLTQWQDRVSPREKGPADLVTEADLAAQEVIQARLAEDFPGFYFIGEEGAAELASEVVTSAETCSWIVDPLDGTTNYVHGLDNYCVSIALRRGTQLVLGVVYDPSRDQLFHAVRGAGAFVNGKQLHVSTTARLDKALVAASLSARVAPNSSEVLRFIQTLYQTRGVRRLGSAALNLCYVAAGKLDAYWATSINIWDVAAGLVCVEEAGGLITSIDGGPLNLAEPRLLVSATQPLHEQLLSVLDLGPAHRVSG